MISFEPFNKKTISIQKTLSNFSTDKNISIKSVDFTLEAYETLIRRKGIDEDMIIEDTNAISQEFLLSKDARIYQKYDIKIMPSELDISSYKLSLAYNQRKTKVIVTIKAGSIFSKDNKLEEKLRETIWHRKLAAGFLVGIFEEQFEKQLKKLLTILPYGKKLSKDLKFTAALGIEPVESIDSQIDRVYLERKEKEHNYIDGVDIGELILRYKKHKEGIGGRSCEGKYIPPKKPLILKVPKTDETIRVEENDEYIEFYANDKGYVDYENDFLKISKTLKLEGAHFNTTGDLDAGELNEEVSVAISHAKGAYEDAISGGLTIDVKELNVDGAIGSNVKVSACDINIDAQTHRNAKLEVKNKANIKLHRGDLVANEAEIEILEAGRITAHKSIKVKKMVGGELIAPKIYVEELGSNAKIIASEEIEIKSIQGSQNTLTIDPDKIEAYHKEKEKLIEQIKQLSETIETEHQELELQIQEHSSEIERIKTFQRRILQAQKAGKSPMKQDIIRVKEFKRKSQAFQDKRLELQENEARMKDLKSTLQKMLTQDLHAEIRTNSIYDGHSKVVFVNPENGQSLSFLPEGKIETISLTLDQDQNRVIKTTP